ncbi:putative blue pigment (indigoidine) exporter [Deinococcus metalli]|uniref:ABC transporter permease n=1 Tax=Deinococcus metalli TaxID=1141878 RepID=A0A7W8NMI4_9DEIO|nr:EamA family transporter [Deinococcus metalli]MBB5374721.1 putative blue pigment (indigoidine) exporter [Deinococcus metalli]GHF34201.1 ABC transporter permease [Deinococcus metalli]
MKLFSPLTMAALAPLSWGTSYLVLDELRPLGPLTVAALRALLAGVLLLLVVRELPRGMWWGRSLLLGALNFGLFFGTLFISASRLSGGVAATLGALGPLLIIAFNLVAWRQAPTRHTLGAALLGLVGVALLVLGPGARLDPWGVVAGVVSVVAASGGYLLSSAWGTPPGTAMLSVTAWQLTWGGVLLVPLALLLEGVPALPTAGQWPWLAYMVVVTTALAYALWFRGIQHSSAVQVSLLTRLSPATALLIDLLRGHTLSGGQWAGLALIALSFVPERPAPAARAQRLS